MEIIIQILITMAFSAYFSGMEIAFVSSNKLRFEMDRNEQSLTSRILSIFYHNPNNFISTMLVGNNIALVIYGILMAELIEQQLLADYISNEFLLVLTQTIISTLSIFAIPTFICYVVLYPISKFASGISNILLRLTGTKINKEASAKAFTKVDLDHFIQSSIENSANEEDINTEVKIFQNALDFSSIKIRDCMVPRTEIIAIEDDASMEELMDLFVEKGISKIIVYQDNIDNIIGYIHSSEMFQTPDNWQECIRQLPIVPETMNANKLMKLFMQQKKSLAVVVDEFGGTSGIVALEDLVEQIFGEIEDEHDTTSYVAKAVGNNEYVLSGRLDIEKANELFDLELPESDEYQTIGGLILHHHQSIPKAHEIITLDKFQFRMIKVTATKIELVKLKVSE